MAAHLQMESWSPPAEWLRIRTIDAHTGGEPFRIVTGGLPEVKGDTILERRRYAKSHLDHLRRALMLEPRGHPDMYGCIITPPELPDSDIGVLFLHNEGYSTMCGHGIIALTAVLVETGTIDAVAPLTTLKIDAPAGQITAHAHIDNAGKLSHVSFLNVPSYVVELDAVVDVAGLGKIRYDLAFGGAFYAYVDAEDAGVQCRAGDFRNLIDRGMAIKHAVMQQREITHPVDDDLAFLYGVIFVGEPGNKDNHSRNVCVFAEGEVDRSPTGTGVSGRLAIHHARGQLGLRQPATIESIIGSSFTGRVEEEVDFGGYPAIIPHVAGTAHISGRHEFLIDPEDPLKHGFFLR